MGRLPVTAIGVVAALVVAVETNGSAGLRREKPDAQAAVPAVAGEGAACGGASEPVCDRHLRDIALYAPGQGWAVGDDGFIARFSDGRLEPVDSPTAERLDAVAAISAGEAWAVGDGLFRLTAGTWTQVLSSEAVGGRLVDIDVSAPDTGLAVGEGPRVYRYSTDGWTPDDLDGLASSIVAVDILMDGTAWAVDAEGAILRFADGAWAVESTLDCRPNCWPTAIAMTSDTEGWVAGLTTNFGSAPPIPYSSFRTPLLYRRGPDGWRMETLPALTQNAGIEALAIGFGSGWASADTGGMLRLRDGLWSWHHAPAGLTAQSIVLDRPDTAWGVGPFGSVFRMVGGCWTRVSGPRLALGRFSWQPSVPGELPPDIRALVWRAFLPSAAGQAAGPRLERLTDNPEDEWQPALSPDGQTLAYTIPTGERFSALVARDACGNTHLTAPVSDFRSERREETPSFGLDGRSIVHGEVHSLDGRDYAELARIAPDGSGRARIELPEGTWGFQPRRPNASPDGRWIAFDAEPGEAAEPLPREIFVLDVAGGSVARLTDHPAEDRLPVFAADSRTIFFRSERDGNSEIYSIRSDGSGLRRLTRDPAFDTWPSPAPDGRTLVFQSDRPPGEGIYAIDLGTGATTRLTPSDYRALTPRYAPDGRVLLFAADIGGQLDIYTMPAP